MLYRQLGKEVIRADDKEVIRAFRLMPIAALCLMSSGQLRLKAYIFLALIA